MKKTIQKRMVLKKVYAKFLWNRKDTVSVVTGNELAGHTKSPFLIIHVTTRWTETAFAGKRYRFKFTTMGTAVDSLSIRRIVAMDHTFDVIHNIFARTKSILDVLKVVTENSLKNVLFIHKNILQQKVTKENRICTLFIMKVLLMEKVRAPAVLSLVKPDNILSR